MEYQKITLFENTPYQPSKFRSKNYNTGSQIEFKT